MDKHDPYGVMNKPQYRGRRCTCGTPLPTGKYRCDKCTAIRVDNDIDIYPTFLPTPLDITNNSIFDFLSEFSYLVEENKDG